MTINAMSVRDAYSLGFEHGHSLASWNASEIQFGETLCRSIDYIGIGRIESVEDWLDAFDCVISSADESSRCYSPFEIYAARINARDEKYGECSAESGWEAYERGLQNGAAKYRRAHYPIRELKRDLKEWESDQ